jgi:hypothetical protein
MTGEQCDCAPRGDSVSYATRTWIDHRADCLGPWRIVGQGIPPAAYDEAALRELPRWTQEAFRLLIARRRSRRTWTH